MATTNEFLRRIDSMNVVGKSRTVVNEPIPITVQELINAGLVKPVRLLKSSDHQPTGEIWLTLTNEGKERLKS